MIWPEATITEAADFDKAWQLASESPAMILCDLVMPGATPLEGVARLRGTAPDVPLVVITGSEDDALLLALFDLGIAGFVPKSAGGEIVELALRLVAAGGRYVPPRIVELANQRPDHPKVSLNGNMAHLTYRQLEVLQLVAEGHSNKEIARQLDLSPATVKTHVAAIIGALDANNRTDAAFRARQAGVIRQ